MNSEFNNHYEETMRYYTEDHVWIEVNGDDAVMGITEYIADELGEVKFVELPEEDGDFIIGDLLGSIEADENCDIYSPISGTVCAVNENLADEPDLINEAPEGEGWFCRFTNFDNTELDDMMSESAYRRYLKTL